MTWSITLLYWLAVTLGADNGIPPCIFKGLISVESSWQIDAVGAAGEIGLGQLSRHEWESYNVNPWDPHENLSTTAKIIGKYYRRYGSWDTALAAYNAGEGAVARYGGPPPYVRGYLAMVRERGLAGRWGSECSAGWPTP
jgi:soluble lytic murein transglycosylase-like protein